MKWALWLRLGVLAPFVAFACGSEEDGPEKAAPDGSSGSGATGGSAAGGKGGAGAGGEGGAAGQPGTGGAAGSGGAAGTPGIDGSDGAALDVQVEQVDDPECSGVCINQVAAQCEQGPPEATECVRSCNALRAGPCGNLLQALMTCAGPNPTVTCDPTSKTPVFVGCETQTQSLYACIADAGNP